MYGNLSTGQKSELRATALYIIQSIVEKHRGSMETDLLTDTICIDVPDKEEAACAEEIEEQLGVICC